MDVLSHVLGIPKIGGGGGVVYLLRDLFTTDRAAGSVDGTASEPAPGVREVTADSGSNLSIADDQLQIAAAVSDTDPALYWTRDDGSGFTRENGLALIAYHLNGAWVGWSNSTTLATSALLYGAKGRDAYAAGVVYSEALPIGDPVHIIVLSDTGAQHIVRYGTDEYLAFTYPSGSDATLYPALLGDVCQLEALYVYKVAPVLPAAALNNPAQGVEFTHPAGAIFIEIELTTLSTSADTVLVFREQDAQNRIELRMTAGRRLQLYKRVENTLTVIANLSANGEVTDGSRIVVQLDAGGRFQTSFGSGTTCKSWVGTIAGATTGDVPFDNATSGRIQTKPSGTSFGAIKVYGMAL